MPVTYDVIETYEKALEAEKQKNYLKAARLYRMCDQFYYNGELGDIFIQQVQDYGTTAYGRYLSCKSKLTKKYQYFLEEDEKIMKEDWIEKVKYDFDKIKAEENMPSPNREVKPWWERMNFFKHLFKKNSHKEDALIRLRSNMHAAEIICACWNNLDISIIEPYLSEDVIWKGKVHSGPLNDATLAIGSPITVKGKRNYLEYLEKMFARLRLLEHGSTADIVYENDEYRARITIDNQDEDEVYRLTIESGLITEIQTLPSFEWWKKQLGTSPFGVISKTSLHEQAAAVAAIEELFKTELGNKEITWAPPYELKNSHCQLSFNCEGLDYDVLIEIHSWNDNKCRFVMKSEFDRLKVGCQENDHIPCILALDEEDQFVSFTLAEKMEVIIPKLRSKGIDECAFKRLFKK